MKVLYDYRPWQDFYGRGVARYIEDLFGECIKQLNTEAFILLHENGETPNFYSNSSKVHICYEKEFENKKFEKNEFDIYINGSACRLNASPATVLDEMYPKSVIETCRYKTAILHDFIPLFFQNYIWDDNQKISFALQYDVLRKFDHIFGNSKYSCASAFHYIPIEKEKLTVLYGGVNNKKFSSKNSSKPYSSRERKNHIVYVGGFASQKNYQGVINSFCKAYKEKSIPEDSKFYLICSASQGSKDEIKNLVEKFGIKYGKQVIVTGYISDEKMLEIVSSAKASIFPSYLEGLGLPILESYAAGTPCWASGVHSTKEITLPECTFNPFDEISMKNAITEIYHRPDLCEKSLDFGRTLLKEITWENAAKKMIRVFEQLLRN